jgi:L-alanine-DL-glutamate epimerase-like enolase superfamily enzyme
LEVGSSNRVHIPVERISVHAYTIPTDAHESDGTLEWDATTMIVVDAEGGGATGVGYTYSDQSAASLISRVLSERVTTGADAMDVEASYDSMVHAVRNLGQQGLAATAISAVDIALWDLKAHLLDTSLISLLGAARDAIPVYGSGGFT